MPIFNRYLDNQRNKFAGTGLYDNEEDLFNDGFMADTPGPSPSLRKNSMVAPPEMPAFSAQPVMAPPPPRPAMPEIPDPEPDEPVAPPVPPPGVAGPKPPDAPEDIIAGELKNRMDMKRPDIPKPNKWQMLAAGAIGGLQGYKNAARPQDRSIDLISAIPGIVRPNVTRQQVEFDRKVADVDDRLGQADKGIGIIGKVQDIARKRQADAENAADRKANLKEREAEKEARNTQFLFNAAQAGGQIVKATDPVKLGAIRVANPADKTGQTYIEVVPTKGTVKITDKELARTLGVELNAEVPQSSYLKGLDLLNELEKAKITAGSKTPKNLNPADILLHPEDFSADQVKKAQELFDKEHRPPRDPNSAPQKAVPPAIVQKVAGNNSSLRTIDAALSEMENDPAATGMKGYVPGVILNRLDPKGTNARAAISNIGSLQIHDRTGAAMTASEAERLRPFIPSLQDDHDTVIKKLKQLKTQIQAINSDLELAYSDGYKPMPVYGETPKSNTPSSRSTGRGGRNATASTNTTPGAAAYLQSIGHGK